MARNGLLIWLSGFVFLCLATAQEGWRRPVELVRALDLEKSNAVGLLDPEGFLTSRLIKRVRLIVNVNDPSAPAHSVDVIVLYDALHGIGHRDKFYPKLRRLLRPGGRVVNIDLFADPPGIAPEPKLSESQTAQEFLAAGFHISKTVGLLPFQYFQVFE
jgi:Methyltransferase domain